VIYLRKKARAMRFSWRQILVLCCDVAICVAGVCSVIELAKKAELPCSLRIEQYRPVVSQVSTVAYHHGMREGDKLQGVDGIPITRITEVELLLDRKQPHEWITLQILRDTLERQIDPFNPGPATTRILSVERQRVLRVPLSPRVSTWELLIVALCAGLFFAVGVAVYLKKSDDEAAKLFHGASVLTAILISASYFYPMLPMPVRLAMTALNATAALLMPVMFLHFTYRFPAKNYFGKSAEQDNRRWRVMYALASLLILMLCIMLMDVDVSQLLTPEKLSWLATVITVSQWCFAGCMVWGVINFMNHYMMADEEADRRKLRWILIGLLAGPLTFAVLWLLPKQLIGEPVLTQEAMLLISTLTPLTFAISIVRYRLMDIDLIFNRGTVYALMLSAVIGAYILLMNLIALIAGEIADWKKSFWMASLTTVLALLFEPVRQRVQAFVDRRFFYVQYNYRQVQRKVLQEINRAISVQQLAQLLLEQIDEFLKPKFSCFLLKNRAEKLECLAQQPLTKSLELSPFEALAAKDALPLANPKTVEQGAVVALLEGEGWSEAGVALVFPLYSERRTLMGWLILGEKMSKTLYSDEDIDLLTALAVQASALVEKMMLQNALMLQAAETERLKELAEMRAHFVSGVSHDLRTPLTSIKLFAELLENEVPKQNRAAQDYLEIIQEQIARLERMIANVLAYAKSERQTPTLNAVEIDLTQLVCKTLENMSVHFKAQQCAVEMLITSEPLRVLGERDALIQMVENLLFNAIKYSPNEKKIKIELTREGRHAVLRISDTGIGIAEDELQKIFEPFYRSSRHEAKQVGGTGLGLALVKQTVQAHQGKIHVQSELGKGSTFTVMLPLAAGAE
jgi:signal transduction histidine kinase